MMMIINQYTTIILSIVALTTIVTTIDSSIVPKLRVWGGIQSLRDVDTKQDDAILNSNVSTTTPTTLITTSIINNNTSTNQQPLMNGTATNGPHLFVSGHLMSPATHHRMSTIHQQHQQQQQQALFRAPFDATTQMRTPSNYYYGTPLLVNHTIPIPHTPSHWRMSSSAMQPHPYYRQRPTTTTLTQPAAAPTTNLQSQNQTQQSLMVNNSTQELSEQNLELINERNLSTINNQTTTNNDNDDDSGSHRSFFGDHFGSLFGGKKLLHKEEEYDGDEYEEEVKLPPKKLLGKLGSKKEKVLAVPVVEEPEYEAPVVVPSKKLKIKKPKVKPVLAAAAASEYGGLPAHAAAAPVGEYGGLPAHTAAVPAAGEYGGLPAHAAALPLPTIMAPPATGYAKSAPALAVQPISYPAGGHYRIDSDPKGKFVPQFRQDANAPQDDGNNSTILETRATLTGVRSAPNSRSQVMNGYLAQEVRNFIQQRNDTSNTTTTTTTTNVDDRNKYSLNAYSDPYGGKIFNLSPDIQPAYPSASIPLAPPLLPPPVPAYPAPSYGVAGAVPALPLSYSKVLSKVLDYYPAAKAFNYSTKYDYSMPVAVVNMLCSDPKYPCTCTIYLTEINSYNMLISGVCSGLPKDTQFLMNLYPNGDITAGCNALSLSSIGYRSGSYVAAGVIELGMVKSDYHGVAFVNKLKHASIGVSCDAYGYKDSILGRAVGLVEMAMPALAIPVPVPVTPAIVPPAIVPPVAYPPPSPPPPPVYRRTAAAAGYGLPAATPAAVLPVSPVAAPAVLPSLQLPLTPGKIAACGVIGLAAKDNSYETRELKSRLIANAKNDELMEYRRKQIKQPA